MRKLDATMRYQAVLVVIAAVLVVFAVPYGIGNPYAVLGLAAVAAVAEQSRVRLANDVWVTISVLPTVFAAAVFGPLAALVIGACSLAGDFPVAILADARNESARGQLQRWGIYTCVRAIYGAAAGFAAAKASSYFSDSTTSLIVATVVAAVVAEPLDLAFAAFTVRLRANRERAVALVRMYAPMLVVSMALYTPVVAALAVAYVNVSPWTLALFFLPALAAQRLFGLYQEQRQLASQLAEANIELEKANISFATALVTTLDARDRYTAGHSAAVAIYARDIATRMALPEEDANMAHLAGLVHDIGKIGLSPGVLEKPGALTLDERREMQRHSEIGERILNKVDSYAEIARVVRHHHERVDGGGYPDGLTEDEIPLLARIIAVADAYNAMTSDRPYRDAMPSRVARLRLAQAVGSQFDTTVVAAFEAVLAMATESYRTARSDEFSFEWQEAEAASVDDRLSSSKPAESQVPALSISA
jgi:putative nucleotidyltransferase with HDIG domain